jgi:hypothetical protein
LSKVSKHHKYIKSSEMHKKILATPGELFPADRASVAAFGGAYFISVFFNTYSSKLFTLLQKVVKWRKYVNASRARLADETLVDFDHFNRKLLLSL